MPLFRSRRGSGGRATTGTPPTQPSEPAQAQQRSRDTYTADELDDLEELASDPSDANLRRASNYMVHLLAESRVGHGLMGGYSLYLRGSGRRTIDVDIAVNCTMRRLREIVASQPGLVE